MQAADLNLALEQINGLYGQGLRLIELSERLSGGLTMELALEADRVLPSLKASDLYFSAAKAQNQLALEGIVESIVEGLRKLFKKIVDTIKRALSWLGGLGFTTREERRDKYKKQLAAEMSRNVSFTQELRQGKYDATIEQRVKADKSHYSVLSAVLYDHPGRTICMWDPKSPYNGLIEKATAYLEEARPRMDTTSKIMEEVAGYINRMELDKIPHTLEALKNLWAPLEKKMGTAHEIAHSLQNTVNAALSEKIGDLKFSHAFSLSEDFPEALYQNLNKAVSGVAHPLELVNQHFDMMDQAIKEVHKAGESVGQVPGMKRVDGGNEAYRAALAAVHEVALLVFKVSSEEIVLAQMLPKVSDAHGHMSHAWLLAYMEATQIVEIEAANKRGEINGKK